MQLPVDSAQSAGEGMVLSPANRQPQTANYFEHSPSHLPEYFVFISCSPTVIFIEPV